MVPIMLLIITIQGTNPLFHAHLDRFDQDITLDNYPYPTILINNKGDSVRTIRTKKIQYLVHATCCAVHKY